MKKLLLISILLSIFLSTFGQNVATNSGSGLDATYATLADAITALNAATINSSVTITLTGDETAPAGGYAITASGTAANTITIQGSGTITAYTPQATASVVDAIFKIVGGDYITIQNFSMQENVGNSDMALASNTMTEFGVALFYTSLTDGAQNNTIYNNSISLGSTYQNTVGIYSNTRHSSANAAGDASNNTGLNSGLKIYKNTITNVAFGIKYISPLNTATLYESGVEIGGSTIADGNTITYGNNTAADAGWTDFGAASAGIDYRNGIDANINYNTITSNLTIASTGIVTSAATAPAGKTFTQTISNNSITMTNTGTTAITGIDFGIGTGTPSAINNFSATYNTITLNQNSTAANAAAVYGIQGGYTANDRTCSNNNITINQSETDGALSSATTAISLGTSVVTGATTASSNTILISQTNNSGTATTAPIIGINIQGLSGGNAGATQTMNTNTISVKQSGTGTFSNTIFYMQLIGSAISLTVNDNILNTGDGSLNTSGNINGIKETAVMSSSLNMNNNTINMDCGTSSPSFIYGMQSNAASKLTSNNNMNNNTITLISNNTKATGVTSGIVNYDNATAVDKNTKTLTGNTITITGGAKTVRGMDLNYGTFIVGDSGSGLGNTISLTSSYVSPTMYGIYAFKNASAFSISYNDIATISATATGANAPILSGIYFSGINSANSIFNNTIHGISTGAGSGNATITGIDVVTCSAANFYNNFIYDLTTACTGNTSSVIGIRTIKTCAIYNNIISLGGNNSSTIYGLYDVGTAAYNPLFYYNTVYIYGNPTTGANNSAALYSGGSTSIRSFKNNIFQNARSNSGGTGKHFAAYFAYTTEANLTCNYNSYAATGVNGGTLGYHGVDISSIADWRTATAQDVNSNIDNPTFASPGTTAISYKPTEYYNGTTVAGYTTDFTGATRTTFSIGAYEGQVSATTDHFKSTASGNWGANGSWRTSPDNIGWVSSALAPTSSAASVAIQSGNTIDIADNATAQNLTIQSGGILNVNAGKQFTVSGTMANSGTLNLKSTVDGTATITTPTTIGGTGGTTTVENYLGNTRNWYVSSPVSKANAPAAFTYYKYDEPGNNPHSPFILYESAYWENVTSGTELLVGRGYVALPDAASTLTFTTQTGGTLTTGDVTIPLTWVGADKKGFNLIGNPYPSHLTWTQAFVDATSAQDGSTAPIDLIEPSIYYRTKTGDGNTGGWSFPTYNAHSEVATLGGTAIIPPMQAFWVRAKQDGNLTLKIDETALTLSHQNANPLRAPAVKNTDRQRVRLQVSNGTNLDEALIYFDANAQNTFDNYDSPKMMNNSETVPDLYTKVADEKLVINGLSEVTDNLELQLGVRTGKTGIFTFKATELSNFDSNTKVFLRDKQENSEIELSAATEYSFNSTNTTTNESRFSILFKSPSNTTGVAKSIDNQTISIFKNTNGNITVNCFGSINSESSVTVCNLTGQRLVTKQIVGLSTEITNPLKQGMYLVTVANGSKSITKKVLL